MIKIPVVGQYDCETKERILEGKGAIPLKTYRLLGSNFIKSKEWIDSSEFNIIKDIWPSNSVYDIIDGRSGISYNSTWISPISLGDDVRLSPGDFVALMRDHFSGREYITSDAKEYLRTLIEDQVEEYKLLKKMERLNDTEGKRKH